MTLPAHELVRQGSKLIEYQERQGYGLRIDAGGHLHGCALGAIVVALEGDSAGVPAKREHLASLRYRYLKLLRESPAATQPCPGRGRWPWQGHYETCNRVAGLANQVAHLNDRHGWSFDRIADWLEKRHADWLISAAPTAHDTDYSPLLTHEAVASAEELLRRLADDAALRRSLSAV